MTGAENLSSISLTSISGEATVFGAYAGKAVLVVNVASQCGYTPQYAGLEALYRRFKNRGFVVLGFPCDQFGGQEPGADAEIAGFCALTYDVTFPMFAKAEVNGAGAHPLFKALKAAAPGVLGIGAVKWNFTKFLVDKSGRVVRRFGPAEKPEDFAAAVEAVL